MTLTTLVVLLMQARFLNERNYLTGALLYGAEQLMQAIEGDEAVVKDPYERIGKNRRHVNIRTLVEGPIAGRRFAQWAMLFGEVLAAEFQVLQRVAAYQSLQQMADYLAAREAVDNSLPIA
jgi:hypothetical protein